MTHKVKILKQYLNRILNGSKTSEVRYNDRDYQVGDTVELHYFHNGLMDEKPDAFYVITHIHSGLGMKEDYVVLSFKNIKTISNDKD